MSAGLLRRVVDIWQRYRAEVWVCDSCLLGRPRLDAWPWHRARLGPDEFVEASGVDFAIDRDRALCGASPSNRQPVQRSGEQIEDVHGHIGEVIADAHDAAIVGDDAAAVTVDEPDDKFFGGAVDEFLLPSFKRDAPIVLRPGPCCGSRQGQCFEYR